ncbi:MAG: AI-2E family transporter [Polyangiales bacterium]
MLPATPVEGVGRTTLVIVACLLVLATLVAVRSLIAPLLLGACVGAMVRPWMLRLRRFGPKRAAAAAVAGVVLVIALPVAAIVVPVVTEIRSVVALIRSGSFASLHPRLGDNLAGSPRALLRELGPRIADALPSLLGTASEIALGVFVFLMTLYYALVDGERAMAFVRRISPLEKRHFDALTKEFVLVGRAVLVSVALTALVEGGAAGIAYFAIGLKSAAMLTAITAIAALIPIGTILVWGPLAAMLYAEGRPFAASVIVFTGLVVISGIDHFARPHLARITQARVHPLLVLVGMFGGMASLGGWGLFAGPLLVALGVAALRLWDREQRARALLTTGLPPATLAVIEPPERDVAEE